MGIAKIFSVALYGMKVYQVTVEVHVASGLPQFSMVGLPDTEVRESRDRVRSAIQNSGFDFPARRITVNLAPADIPKESGRYDLPIAIGVLLASKLITTKLDLESYLFAGEIALDGKLRQTKGLMSAVLGMNTESMAFILPSENAQEMTFVQQKKILSAHSLNEVIGFLESNLILNNLEQNSFTAECTDDSYVDFSSIKGQVAPKKALEIAAAGRHSVLMYGVPGCGKSMLAKSITSILPRLDYQQAAEVAAIYSNSTVGFNPLKWSVTPFRSPHHTTSAVAMVGGGNNPKPGEVSLAHHGVLFLDELPEFARKVLEVLREPLENKVISVSRAKYKVDFAADFQLIAAMNPCPCGNYGSVVKICKCTQEQIIRYNAKISGPLIDRIDLIVPVQMLKNSEFDAGVSGDTSAQIAERVISARQVQLKRQGKLNYLLSNSELETYCLLSNSVKSIARQIVEKNNLSVRSYYRMLKLALTIHDLDGRVEEPLSTQDISLASFYRSNFIA